MKNQQIVFVDSAVEDWQSLAVGVKAGTEVILVDRARDGIEQIAEALQSRKGIESVHIISHGESGSLQLGQTSLNSDNLETYRDCLKQWFSSSVNSLQNRFEILLYGCNVAAGKKGEAFVQKLSKLTKANIAASADITGSAQKGGNWVLEYATVAIKTGLAIEPEVMANYAHTLATLLLLIPTMLGRVRCERRLLKQMLLPHHRTLLTLPLVQAFRRSRPSLSCQILTFPQSSTALANRGSLGTPLDRNQWSGCRCC